MSQSKNVLLKFLSTNLIISLKLLSCQRIYRSGTVNSNTVNSKFHLIRSYYEIFFYHFPNIPCLKCTVNSNFHLIRSKILPMNDFELTVPDLYTKLQNHVENKYMIICFGITSLFEGLFFTLKICHRQI